MKHIFPNHRYYYYFNKNKSHNTNHNWCIHLLQRFKIPYKNVPQNRLIIREIHSNIYNKTIYQRIINARHNNILIGDYLQSFKYFDHSIKNILNNFLFQYLQKDKIDKLFDYNNSAFIHIRGGDYLLKQYSKHKLDLVNYYNTCINTLDCKNILVITNDKKYADYIIKKIKKKKIDYTFVDLNAFESMYVMTKCRKGAICSNSSFSWWGSYLNTNKLPIYFPNRWYRNDNRFYKDMYFEGSIPIEI